MSTFGLDKNYEQFNLEKISIKDLHLISGGTGGGDSFLTGFNYGLALGTIAGAVATGSTAGATRGGIIGGALGASYGLGHGIGTVAYNTFVDSYY